MVNTKGDIFMYVGPFSHSISCSPLEDLRSETAALADVDMHAVLEARACAFTE